MVVMCVVYWHVAYGVMGVVVELITAARACGACDVTVGVKRDYTTNMTFKYLVVNGTCGRGMICRVLWCGDCCVVLW